MTKLLIKISAIIALIGTAFFTLYYFIPQQMVVSEQIESFQEDRDTKEILNLIEKDRYWLIASPHYSSELMLKNRNPNPSEAEYEGKLDIKVLYDQNQFVGFVAYYLKNFYTGQVLFLAVKDDFRGKGYGKQLLEYAIAQLKRQGASVAFLVTRVSNLKAQAVYKKVGFAEAKRDDEFVYFTKQL